ncbi:GAF domain-containing protein [Microbacterium sp. NPDC058345]|uniref:GAF domain-containing protein n=1 Tax=Microbacterium sp. NPDC058345 TaxID=3346455 RepID=UPI003662ED1A
MRSRSDDVPAGLAVERALTLGLCGLGGRLDSPPSSLAEAVAAGGAQHDERLAGRIARFAAAPLGAYVWTKDADGMLWLGRLVGHWQYDAGPRAHDVDLVHVRQCAWLRDPVPDADAPAAVHATFRRGGRNWQRIHAIEIGEETAVLWNRPR